MSSNLLWPAEAVIRAVHGHCLQEQSWQATGVSIDSRAVQKGDLFVALKGPTHDGHDHVAAAFEAGAAAAIVSRQPLQIPAQAPLVTVEDTFAALEDLGRAGRARTHARIAAVTGSVGKTSSKEMLRLMLSAVGSTYANEGSLNNHWGVPLSLARLPENAQYGVFELGMNHAGELTNLSQQAQPDISLITTIEAVHLEFFDSLEAIADAKAEIFIGTKKDGAAILNRDNAYFAHLATAAKNRGLKGILSFGRDSKSDARLLNYTPTAQGGDVSAEINGRKITFQLNVPGEHLALNALGCLLSAVAIGGDLEACTAALAHYQQPKGRGVTQKIELRDGSFTLIDESYNASPAAVRAALRVLNQTAGNRKILVLGDMKELGEHSPALHTALIDDILTAKVDLVFTCGEATSDLFYILPEKIRGKHAKNSDDLAPIVANSVHAGDVVTIKGSNSMKMNKIVEALKALDIKNRKLAS